MLRIDQVKSIYLPLTLTSKEWNKVLKNCPSVVPISEVIKSYLDLYGVELHTDNTLAGTGSISNPLKLAQQNASFGQTLIWGGSSWIPGSQTALPSGAIRDELVYNGSAFVAISPKLNIQVLSAGTTATIPHVPSTLKPPQVYLNGLLKEEGSDYTISGNTITFIYAFALGDKLIVKYYI